MDTRFVSGVELASGKLQDVRSRARSKRTTIKFFIFTSLIVFIIAFVNPKIQFCSNAILYNSSCLMKTTIIKVDLSDDIQSIRDRIAWSNSQRVLLIIPRKKVAFPDERGLVLLFRAAEANGAQLGLVTGQPNRREFARRIGVSVFHSVAQAEREVWVEPPQPIYIPPRVAAESITEMRKKVPAESKGFTPARISKSTVIIASAIIFLVVILLILPSATLVIYPETQLQEQVVEIHAVTTAGQNSLSGIISAQKRTFTLTGEMSAQSSGSVAVGKTRAIGEVLVTNLTNQEIVLPEGTGFSTGAPDQQKFISTQEVIIPGRGYAVTIPIKAVLAGEVGNVAAGEIVLIEGPAGSSLRVTNDTPTSGGSSVNLPAPSEEDFDRLTAQLLDDLSGRALEQSMFNSAVDRKPILESLMLDELIASDRGNPAGEPADTLSLNITAQFSVLYYDPVALDELLNAVMDLSMPAGFQAAKSDMTVEKIGDLEVIGTDEAAWKVIIRRQVVKSYSQQDLRKMIKGRSFEQAVAIVNREIPHVRSAEIRSFLGWWPYIPVLLEQIDFEERLPDGR